MYRLTPVTLVVFMLIVSSTAWSADIQRSSDRRSFKEVFQDMKAKEGAVMEFVIDANRVISANPPSSFDECKSRETKEDTSGFPLAFKQDVRNGQVQITNNETKFVARITISFKNTGSTITQTHYRGVVVDPQSSKVFSILRDLRLSMNHRVISITGFAPTIVECKEKFTAEEMTQLRKEKADKEMKLQEQRAKEREDALRWEILFDNCMADKLPLTENRELNASVRNICERIATNPNWWHRFWYSD